MNDANGAVVKPSGPPFIGFRTEFALEFELVSTRWPT